MPRVRTPRALELRIFGAENVKGRITHWRDSTRGRIAAALQEAAPDAVEGMREMVRAAYPWGGKLAQSLDVEVSDSQTGPTARISITAYREVKYLTTLLPESDFRETPYPIVAVNRQRLNFYWQRIGRRVAPVAVTHPGFGRQGDVLRESGAIALTQMGRAVEMQVRSAVAEVQAGGRIFSVSRRR